MNLKEEYKQDESPLERLRGRLTPFFTLADIIERESKLLEDGPLSDFIKDLALECGIDAQDAVRNNIDDAATIIKELQDFKAKHDVPEGMVRTGGPYYTYMKKEDYDAYERHRSGIDELE